MSGTPGRAFDPIFLATALVIYVADQITKAWAVAALGPGTPVGSMPVVGDWLRLTYATNTGAAFGMLQSAPWLFASIAIIAAPLIWWVNRTMRPSTLLTRICLGGLLGGALGNLTDRLRLGYVVDFVDAGIGDLRWPAFNVADSAFVVGVIALCVYVLFFESRGTRDA